MRVPAILWRCLRLRCTRCGKGKVFDTWIRMRHDCDQCGLVYEREPGFFLGSIYFNYGVTAVIITTAWCALYFGTDLPPNGILGGLLVFCLLFPLWFFRYARCLWLGLDFTWDPREPAVKPTTPAQPPV